MLETRLKHLPSLWWSCMNWEPKSNACDNIEAFTLGMIELHELGIKIQCWWQDWSTYSRYAGAVWTKDQNNAGDKIEAFSLIKLELYEPRIKAMLETRLKHLLTLCWSWMNQRIKIQCWRQDWGIHSRYAGAVWTKNQNPMLVTRLKHFLSLNWSCMNQESKQCWRQDWSIYSHYAGAEWIKGSKSNAGDKIEAFTLVMLELSEQRIKIQCWWQDWSIFSHQTWAVWTKNRNNAGDKIEAFTLVRLELHVMLELHEPVINK